MVMRMRMPGRFFAVGLPALLLALPGWAQIYKVTNDDGVVFTDRPETVSGTGQQSVEALELPPLNTVAPIGAEPVSPPGSGAAADSPEVDALEPRVRITSPAHESTIAMGPGDFTVSASPEPPLSRNERLVLTIDGRAYGAAQSSARWFVQGALRGPHDLVVQRTDSRGAAIASSESVRIYVLRPSAIRAR